MTKYIVVTGGVVSGLGKGITISSMGRLLKSAGLRVTAIKIDPYLNTDAGTMSPFEHGETFVLEDGGETDLDLGNYERFLDVTLTRDHNITTGKIYAKVIEKERRGDYLGKTVQVVPHVTDEIQAWIERVAQIPVDGQADAPPDVCLIEVGGTVGDIESSVFLEAIRQFQFHLNARDFCLVHVSLVPCLGSVGEQKTKPTQHGVKELRSVGLAPNLIICRSANELVHATRQKIGIFCQVPSTHVISIHDVNNIYHVPLLLLDQNVDRLLFDALGFFEEQGGAAEGKKECDLAAWKRMAFSIDSFEEKVTIALVGKYTGLADAYLSVLKALKHSSIQAGRALEIAWIDSSRLEDDDQAAFDALDRADGVVVPGGFGSRGIEGMIKAATFCRERKKPYLGVCLGMQLAVIEHARATLGSNDYTSEEFDAKDDDEQDDDDSKKKKKKKERHAVIFMPEIDKTTMGGTMRLGARETYLSEEPSIARVLYGGKTIVRERHRHRYEVNPELVPALEKSGLRFVGKDDSGTRMEIVELPRSVHPFYFGTQFHPEFASRPQKPSPPFYGLVRAACGLPLGDDLPKDAPLREIKNKTAAPTPPKAAKRLKLDN